MTPDAAIARLAGSTEPFLIGVRHHSPACAAAVPKLLEAFGPTRIFVELPLDLGSFLPWLGHPELEAPVALAAVRTSGEALSFYPFADFSPELAAVRWGVKNGVTVEACDRPFALDRDEEEPASRGPRHVLSALLETTGTADSEELWDVLVEARARGEDPEATRRAALGFGWALRADSHARGGVPAHDRAREATMRACIARAKGERIAAVVGSFHTAALASDRFPGEDVNLAELPPSPASKDVVGSLIPYAFDLLDSRSGYPAGIRDPEWQARVLAALSMGGTTEAALAEAVVAIVREVRAMGHVAGVPHAQEAVRMAGDLARLRGLPGPGRREMVEAVESCLAQGERLGRGRVLARAMERVLVGSRRGVLPRGAPRGGLLPHVEALVRELGLPGPGAKKDEPVRLTLDPLRSELDRKRHVALERLSVCGITYATHEDRTSPTSAELLTQRWSVQWVPATDAMLELAGLRGVTLSQAAAGALRAEEKRIEEKDALDPRARLTGAASAAACGLHELLVERLEALGPALRETGSLADVVLTVDLLDRLTRGHVAGVPEGTFTLPASLDRSELLGVAIATLEGMTGASNDEDARAVRELVELMLRARTSEGALGEGRLGFAIDRLAKDGSPLMQGAGEAARVLLGRVAGLELGTTLASWIDAAVDAEARVFLSARLRGVLLLATPLVVGHPEVEDALVDRVDELDDARFLDRLPALRDGFDVLSPAERTRLLEVVAARFGEGPLSQELDLDPVVLAAHVAADLEGLTAVQHLGLLLPASQRTSKTEATRAPREGQLVGTLDRFRLLLGRQRADLAPKAARYAGALDELYGHGRGEGSRDGGGNGAPFPTVREWGAELADLFGEHVREEVLGRAATQGRTSAALELDPEAVTPSIELLEQVLSLKGGLGERDLARLRRLVSRIVDALVEVLAKRVKPALAGLVTPTSTRRSVGPLDLRRTIRENLGTARRGEDGAVTLAPDRMFFKRRVRRSLDWHVILVVDVSGSMEASVIYSAMMAAILSGLPAVAVRFVAFNTEVLDLSDRVDDPLGLLLEISVGGGTFIGKALRYARELVKVPTRTLLVLVSDFEEGGSVARLVAEVRAIAESGVKPLGLAALDDRGAPRFHRGIAQSLADAGMPIAALTPLELARWVGEQIR